MLKQGDFEASFQCSFWHRVNITFRQKTEIRKLRAYTCCELHLSKFSASLEAIFMIGREGGG